MTGGVPRIIRERSDGCGNEAHGDHGPRTCRRTSVPCAWRPPLRPAGWRLLCGPAAPSPPRSALGRGLCLSVSSVSSLEFPCLLSLPSSSRMQNPSFLLTVLSRCASRGAEAQWGSLRRQSGQLTLEARVPQTRMSSSPRSSSRVYSGVNLSCLIGGC